MGLGVILVSAQNFVRLFPFRNLDQVNLGLIRLKPEVDPDRAAASLRKLLGGDIRVAPIEVENTKITQVLHVRGNGLLQLGIERHLLNRISYSLHGGKRKQQGERKPQISPLRYAPVEMTIHLESRIQCFQGELLVFPCK